MAQGIVTYSDGASQFAKGWEVLQSPKSGNYFSATFDGIGDYATFAVTETASPTAAANAGGSAHTITPGASKVRNMATNFTCVANADTMTVEAKIKTATAGAAGSGIFVGFAESTTAGDIITTAGAKVAGAAGKDKIGLLVAGGSANITYQSTFDSADTIDAVDSGRDVADDTYVRLGVAVSASTVKFFIDGNCVKQYEQGTLSNATLIPVLSVAGGTALTLDHFYASVR